MKIRNWVLLISCISISKIAAAKQSGQLGDLGVFFLTSLSLILIISSLVLLALKIVILKQFRIDERWMKFGVSVARSEVISEDLNSFEKTARKAYIIFSRLNSIVLIFMMLAFLLFILGVN